MSIKQAEQLVERLTVQGKAYQQITLASSDVLDVAKCIQELLDNQGEMKDGLERALKLLGRAECENCGRPLVHLPRMGGCLHFSHVDTATQIAELKKLVSSK